MIRIRMTQPRPAEPLVIRTHTTQPRPAEAA